MKAILVAFCCLAACSPPKYPWKALSPEASRLGETERNQQSLLLALWLSQDQPFAASGTLKIKSLLVDEQLSFLLYAGEEDAFRLEIHSFGRPVLIVTSSQGFYQADLPLEQRRISGPLSQAPKLPMLHLGLLRLRSLLTSRPPLDAYEEMTFWTLRDGAGNGSLILSRPSAQHAIGEEIVLDPQAKRVLSWTIGPEEKLIHCHYDQFAADGRPRRLDIEDRSEKARYVLNIEQLVVGPLDPGLFEVTQPGSM